MSDIKESNAEIESVHIRIDNGFCLSVWVFVKHAGGTSQGLGGYALGGTPNAKVGKHMEQKNLAAEFIVRVLMAAGTDDIAKCAGRNIRVRHEFSKIHAIGHILDDDKWFNPAETFASWETAQ